MVRVACSPMKGRHQEAAAVQGSKMDPEFTVIDAAFDRGISVAKGEEGTFYIQSDSPEGHCVVTIRMHPRVAKKLRDWIIQKYPEG